MGGDNGVVITNLVMALPELSAAYEDAVRPGLKSLHDEQGVHPAGAHEADGPEVGGILEAGHAGGVRRRVAAPVAEKSKDLGNKGTSHQVFLSKARI
jgi:hypothetical protein